MAKHKAPPGGGDLLNGLQIAPGATQGCRSPNDTSNIVQQFPNFTGYRLQVTLRWQGLVRPELHCQKQGTEGSGREQMNKFVLSPLSLVPSASCVAPGFLLSPALFMKGCTVESFMGLKFYHFRNILTFFASMTAALSLP